jgi:hypothetical protein
MSFQHINFIMATRDTGYTGVGAVDISASLLYKAGTVYRQ